jgi:polyferredoxin
MREASIQFSDITTVTPVWWGATCSQTSLLVRVLVAATNPPPMLGLGRRRKIRQRQRGRHLIATL